MPRVIRKCRFDLTDEEKMELGQRAARELQSLQQAEESKKEIDAQLKGTIEGHRAQALSFSRTLNNGYEYRDAECDERFDWESGMVIVTRCDTGERVDARPMTTEERQSRRLEF